ncbi:MAG: polysaccharide biosynthesis/export family protein [Flavobacterium sp.]|nr:polysaccharide biosynthesis/export family protein [Flavobacterium sp.]
MNRNCLFILIVIGAFFTSCIPNKQLIYLQTKNENDSARVIKPIVLKPYRLKTDDFLSISIKAIDPKLVQIFNPSSSTIPGLPQSEQALFFDGFKVDDHGNIRIPVIGEINVLGFTTDEVRVKIEKELLAKYFNKEADIFVVVKLAGLRFTINGEITTPGTKTIFQEKLNVLEAVANSGDITILGNRKNVTIIRQFPYGTEMHDIDLTDINVTQSPYYYVQPNDYIYIKPLKQKSWGTGKTGIESFSTIITILSFGTTVFLLLNK